MLNLRSCAPLLRATNHRLPDFTSSGDGDFFFVQLADPQLGLLERYIEKRDPPFHWDRELVLAKRAVLAINNLVPKPKFVMVCGDLIDAQPGNPDRPTQAADLMKIFEGLHPDIRIMVLPGNHDVGDRPSASDLEDYRSLWGDDYFSFSYEKCKFIVVNSQLYWDSSNCPSEAALQDAWLRNELSASENKLADHTIVFQHIPCFTGDPDEKDDYFNLPKENRLKLLHLYHDAGVRFVFSGHLHYNGGGPWTPSDGAPPLQVVSSSAVGVQLGHDSPGLRVVHVSPKHGLAHKYFTFDELESGGPNSNHEFYSLSMVLILYECLSSSFIFSELQNLCVRRFVMLCEQACCLSALLNQYNWQGSRVCYSLNYWQTCEDKTHPSFGPCTFEVKSDSDFKRDSEFRVAAYGISQMIEIAKLTPADLMASNYHNINLPPDVSSEVRFFSRPALSDPTSRRDILVFRSGVCVFWNAPDAECRQMLDRIRKYCDAPVSSQLIEWEELRYFLTAGDTFLDGEDICLHHSPSVNIQQPDAAPEVPIADNLVFEKLAFSDALASSVKLALLETSFDSVALQMQPWLEVRDLLIFMHLLNVSTNITETPDFYWDRPEVEKLFQQLKSALSIQSRTKVIFEFHRLYEKWQLKKCTTSSAEV
ncbi:unnamed protein product [Dibothriocephalus latus]|uniref:Calcineurin-like phosphoesterase domain-containing protein n=1 Tax=Dibothriocephalus latus TaxID=60516 RepID=A0A3P6SXK3_DIBLA|nr:unnamed protein product [Dibothriocephalus latus]